jgi:hypothetical protein
MITTYRLVQLIEEDAAEMASGFVNKIERDPRAAGYLEHVPPPELWKRVHEIYRHLGEWLFSATPADVEHRYREIGARRADQGLSLSQLLYVILATKEFLWEYVRAQRHPEEATAQVLADLELQLQLDQFYSRAVVFAAAGYEERAGKLAPRTLVGAR